MSPAKAPARRQTRGAQVKAAPAPAETVAPERDFPVGDAHPESVFPAPVPVDPLLEVSDNPAVVFCELPIDHLSAHPDNPRRDLGDLTELAASMGSMGLLEPLVVVQNQPMGKDFVVIAGHRRLEAAKLAGLSRLPCLVRRLTPGQQLEAMLIENCQRTDLTPLEEAGAYRQLIDEVAYTQRKLSEKVGRSQSHIAKRLALLQLPEEARTALDSGRITLEEAALLTKLTDAPQRLARALTQGTRSYSSVADTARAELEGMELDRKRQKAEEELRSKGVTVVQEPKKGWGSDLLMLAGQNRYFPGGTLHHVTVKQHAKQKCHAAWVDRRAETVWLCTNPKEHPRPKGEEPAATPEEARRKAQVKERREVEKARRACIREFLAKPSQIHRSPAVSSHIVRVMVALDLDPRGACELLGIPPVETVQPTGWTSKDYGAALHAWAASEDGDPFTAALAIMLDKTERAMATANWEWSKWTEAVQGRHLSLLAKFAGYQPTMIEAAKLVADTKAAAGTATEEEPTSAEDEEEPSADAEPPEAKPEPGFQPVRTGSIAYCPDGRTPCVGEYLCKDQGRCERADQVRTCRVCGCTDEKACPEGCSWIEADLCSQCEHVAYPNEEV